MTAVIAHVSDIHLNVEFEARRLRLRAVLREIAGLPQVDALAITGDIADHGLDEEYGQLREELGVLPAALPIVTTTGNHDRHASYLRAFGERHSVVESAGIRIVGLDTSPLERPPGLDEDSGLLDDDTLAFARSALEASRLPIVVALHHPPAGIGHAAIDATVLRQPDALENLLAGRNVAGIITGHVHTAHTAQFAGVLVAGAPGVASTLVPHSPEKIRADAAYPPGYAVHTVDVLANGSGRMRTRFYSVAAS